MIWKGRAGKKTRREGKRFGAGGRVGDDRKQ